MERISRISTILVFSFALGCSNRPILQEETGQFEDIRKEFDSVVKVKEAPVPKETAVPQKPQSKAVKVAPTQIKKGKVLRKEPQLEDAEGFDGRRPSLDPFRPGERVELSVTYLNMTAGTVGMSVEPFKQVNGERAYHFKLDVKSNTRFSMVYSVANWAETFVDFSRLLPITLTMDQNESARLVESRSFFDWKKNKAHLWEKQVSKKKGEKKKEIEWEMQPFSQNTVSAIYYLRTFTLRPGKRIQFYVTDDGKNYLFKGEVLGRETISTDIGDLKTIIVRPEFQVEGNLKPAGENLIWLTDDDRKFIVKMRAKVKIGSLYAEVSSINPG